MLVFLFIIIPTIYFLIQYNVNYLESETILFFCAYFITALILLIKKKPIKSKILNSLLFVIIPILIGGLVLTY
jgi:hypothetical protein